TARKAANSQATILLLGESGTGKEVLARQIHAWSPVSDGALVAVNCAALSETLLESELFGHEKGAFTGALARKKGRIELAHGGSLFLDEIGDVSEAFQAKLLRVLEERSFERVGGAQTIEVDVRLIAATNRDLAARVAEGAFRQDLYYRLNVIAIPLPPLRERPDDIPALAGHFAEVMARESTRPGLSISPEAMAVLRGHAWPGNIRELRNAIERAIVLADGDELTPEDLPPDLVAVSSARPSSGFHEQVEAWRRKLLEEALLSCNGNRTRAAEKLGLQRTYLARLIRKYGL
ncbi:MAG: sigma-54 interaction domain-containing protein, partial [Planctomycetota bacterium]